MAVALAAAGASAQSPAPLSAKSGNPSPTAPASAPVGPAWKDLPQAQQRALLPLAGQWAGIQEPQKRKWIALSQNFQSLPPAEQSKLHERMVDWAGLSVQQRNQARLNFGETRRLSPEDKKSQWEAYQALSEEEKQRLAAMRDATRPRGAAPALRPVAPQKLATVPQSPPGGTAGATKPRIGVPAQVDRFTLLPRARTGAGDAAIGAVPAAAVPGPLAPTAPLAPVAPTAPLVPAPPGATPPSDAAGTAPPAVPLLP